MVAITQLSKSGEYFFFLMKTVGAVLSREKISSS
jgi:hypothetical protein